MAPSAIAGAISEQLSPEEQQLLKKSVELRRRISES